MKRFHDERDLVAATIYDIARETGFAIGTISRVLNNAENVNPATRTAVLEVMERLGYQPNGVARSLASGSTRTVALVLPDLANPFFASMAAGVEEVADANDYTVLVCSGSSTAERERRYLRLLTARQVDGLLLVGSNLSIDELVESTSQTSVVQIDREVKGADAVVVKLDHRLGGRMATEHLLDLGHTKVAFLGGDQDNDAARARYWGYQDALRDRGVEPTAALATRGALDLEGGAAAMHGLLEQGREFTAVFASNDMMAIGAIGVLQDAGRSVPGDISVVGFDDSYLARYASPPLTTIRQSGDELGRRAAEILLSQIDKKTFPTRVILDPVLIVRASTSQIKGASI